uniref:Helicase/UvrB N-terminal domain-containing protein n=1 Tax=uncultured marine thaumarchaeote AD1000_01_F04 TaxID=1455879 RepID=A0A075FFW2_9ARCH|nr:hypothetical protein [uncultured marine thaumarchaeote AD1000_01_F04]
MTPYDGLANRYLQPLGHLSKLTYLRILHRFVLSYQQFAHQVVSGFCVHRRLPQLPQVGAFAPSRTPSARRPQRNENNNRGQLIMTCGTGKTLTALWIAEGLSSKRTRVLRRA